MGQNPTWFSLACDLHMFVFTTDYTTWTGPICTHESALEPIYTFLSPRNSSQRTYKSFVYQLVECQEKNLANDKNKYNLNSLHFFCFCIFSKVERWHEIKGKKGNDMQQISLQYMTCILTTRPSSIYLYVWIFRWQKLNVLYPLFETVGSHGL